MFGDKRPQSVWPRIEVAVNIDDGYQCMRCKQDLYLDDVALYTRTAREQAFDPWCPGCALILMQWASAGAIADQAMGSERIKRQLQELLDRVLD